MAVTPLFLSKEYLPSVAGTEEYEQLNTEHRGESNSQSRANINHKNWDVNHMADTKIYCIWFLSLMLGC